MPCNFQHPPGAEARSFIASEARPDRRAANLTEFTNNHELYLNCGSPIMKSHLRHIDAWRAAIRYHQANYPELWGDAMKHLRQLAAAAAIMVMLSPAGVMACSGVDEIAKHDPGPPPSPNNPTFLAPTPDPCPTYDPYGLLGCSSPSS